jgi:5-methylcytosine-specific restriction endonuclease McrA
VTPEFQLEFLSKIQRLFAEGDFTATYKFALLISLADLAVERGTDSNETLVLSHQSIGLKFIQLYWQQSAPFSGHDVLVQNLGTQAAVVTAISTFRHKNQKLNFYSANSSDDFKKLLSSVTATVKSQPINYIQNLGGKTETFLFQNSKNSLTLMPGVPYCLRRFQPLIQQLCKTYWVDHVRGNKRNIPLLGKDDDLESFLFEIPRQTLTLISLGLRKLSTKCFYCQGSLREADVDHFIPHSMYPRDLAHNFVLAHPSCNRSKSDTLAAKPHLQRWLDFLKTNGNDLIEIGSEAGVNVDASTSLSVAFWGYENGLSSNSQAWIRANNYEPVSKDYINMLS